MAQNQNQPAPNIALPARFLVPFFVLVGAVLLAYKGFSSSSSLYFIALAAAAPLVYLINNPGVWLIVILGLTRSYLIIPGLPQGLQVVHVMMFGFAIVVWARQIISKPKRKPREWTDTMGFLFIFVIALTAATRGVGIRALGSTLWGGMAYVKLLLAYMFMIAARHVPLTKRQLKASIITMICLSLLPALAQLVLQLSGGRIYQQYTFIEVYYEGLVASLIAAEDGGIVRYYFFGGLGSTLMMFALVMIPFQRKNAVILVIVLGTALLLNGLSGFRVNIMATLGIVCIYFVLRSQRGALARIVAILTVGLLVLLCLFPFAEKLPTSVQRSLSWIPYLPISGWVRAAAQSSVDWRVEIWKMAWEEIPRYLWIGKGLAMESEDVLSYAARLSGPLSAFLSHNYHNGPITLLLDLGIPGLITGSLFLFVSSIEYWKKSKALADNPLIRNFYMFFLASHIYATFAFFLVFGDDESFVTAFIVVGIMRSVVVSSQVIEQKAKAAALATATQALPIPAKDASVAGRLLRPT